MASVKRTFSLPDNISDELDRTIPVKERSKFIAIILEEALREKKKRKFLQLLDTMPRHKNSKGLQSDDLFRKLRGGRAKDIIDNS